jgi:hypothetical protein
VLARYIGRLLETGAIDKKNIGGASGGSLADSLERSGF